MISKALFQSNLERINPDWRQSKYLLAVSGGADSMVLARLFLLTNLSFEIAHVNYHLREGDSNLDQQLVENFCREHQIRLHLYDVSEKDNRPLNSIELWARQLRYRFFFKTLKNEDLDFVVTAHHLNDELETFLINLSRASGLAGLSGIPENQNQILRPLLHFTKAEIYDFAQKFEIQFREDRTNREDDYLRNRIRHHLTPELEKTNPHFWQNFDQSLSYLQDAKQFIEVQIQAIFKSLLVKKTPDLLVLNKGLLAGKSAFVRYKILKSLGFPHPAENQKIFTAENGSWFKGSFGFLTVGKNELIFHKKQVLSTNSDEIKLSFDQKITFPQIMLISEKEQPGWNHRWVINATKVNLPLKLRKPRKAEFFYPAGMKGKKLISKFFRDERIPIFARNDIWVFSDSEDQTLGILNYRQDARFLPEKDDQKIYLYLL